jgi:hypothetical protein
MFDPSSLQAKLLLRETQLTAWEDNLQKWKDALDKKAMQIETRKVDVSVQSEDNEAERKRLASAKATMESERARWRQKRQQEADFIQEQRQALQWKANKLEKDATAVAEREASVAAQQKVRAVRLWRLSKRLQFKWWVCVMVVTIYVWTQSMQAVDTLHAEVSEQADRNQVDRAQLLQRENLVAAQTTALTERVRPWHNMTNGVGFAIAMTFFTFSGAAHSLLWKDTIRIALLSAYVMIGFAAFPFTVASTLRRPYYTPKQLTSINGPTSA